MISSQRYRKISEIYSQAVEMDLSERPAYLEEACAGDPALRSEVEALIQADAQASSGFIETPALDLLARDLASAATRFQTQTVAARFRLLGLLGVGGMGEVYLAEDSKLHRRVALKMLPECFTNDTYRLHRFAREAIAASALNHPNIITVYEIGSEGDRPYIVTEFVDGKTLRQLIEEGLSFPAKMDIVVQVASALTVAHSRGIVHRDLKPENIMVRPDGLVKVLDFGIAHPNEAISQPEMGPGREGPGTGPQAAAVHVEGTIHYMSPEQALARPADYRGDIFSLGVIVYELVCGRRPFDGGNESAVRAAILNHRPKPPSTLCSEAPAAIDRVIGRALAKDPGLRYQQASELGRDLAALSTTVGLRRRRARFSGSAVLSVPRRWLVPSILVAASVIGGLLYRSVWAPTDPPPLFSAGDARFSPLTEMPGRELYPRLLPDGRLLYVAEWQGRWSIFLKETDGPPVHLTPGLGGGASHPAPSPDGSRIAFWSPGLGGIHLLEIESGEVRRLSPEGHNPAWSPDGRMVVYSTGSFSHPAARGGFPSSLWAIDVGSGARRLISENDAVQPSWSPRGHRIAYWGLSEGGRRDIWTVPAEGGEAVVVTDHQSLDWNPVWSPDGRHLYFVSDRSGSMNLWRIRIDEPTGAVLGDPEPVILPAVAVGYIAFSQDGGRLVYAEDLHRTSVYEFEFNPLRGAVVSGARLIPSPSTVATNADLSPDQEMLVHDAIGARTEALFLLPRNGSERRQITDGAYRDRAPRWHPDGSRILFFSDRSARFELWTVGIDGGDLTQLSETEGPQAQAPLWSPDGLWVVSSLQWGPPVLFPAASPTQRRSLDPQSGELLPSPLLAWSWSPDGRKLAVWGEGIYVYDFAEGMYEKVADEGMRPVWLPDNRQLLFFLGGRLYLLDTATRAAREILSVTPLEFQSLGLSRDGKRIFASLTSLEADIWLASPPPLR